MGIATNLFEIGSLIQGENRVERRRCEVIFVGGKSIGLTNSL